MSRRKRFVFVASILLAGALTTAGVIAAGGGSDAGASGDDSPMLVAPTSTTESPPTTRARRAVVTTTTLPLPVPEPPPVDPYADVPVLQIGRIEIPKIALDHAVYEGVTLTVLDHGPGHWPGTAFPGERGNAVFPGHRVTHTHPFYDIDLVAPGDEVIFHMPEADHVYRVTETLIVVPEDLWIVDQTEKPTMTILGCHPKHSARQRFVVKGELVRSTPSLASVALAIQTGDALGYFG